LDKKNSKKVTNTIGEASVVARHLKVNRGYSGYRKSQSDFAFQSIGAERRSYATSPISLLFAQPLNWVVILTIKLKL
jgi:hypothetical protein